MYICANHVEGLFGKWNRRETVGHLLREYWHSEVGEEVLKRGSQLTYTQGIRSLTGIMVSYIYPINTSQTPLWGHAICCDGYHAVELLTIILPVRIYRLHFFQ